MIKVYLLLGSNMGNRVALLQQAIVLLENALGKVAQKSPIYEAEPWGHHEQDHFLNQVLCFNTLMPARNLLNTILNIELEMGRKRFDKWHQRTIDIDILFYGEKIINEPDLNIPHPHIAARRFTLIPMVALASDLVHPECNKTMKEMLNECSDPLKAHLYKQD
jgi:2-amino-4-hydroxy-6-hydroxymethyldihydropteridine diphosphokinase